MRRVAVTGFGVVSAVGVGREAFWQALAQGKSGIGPISRFDASSFDVRLAAEVKETVNLPKPMTQVGREDPKVSFAWRACLEAMTQAGIPKLLDRTLLHIGTSLEIFNLRKLVSGGRPDFAGVVQRSLQPGSQPVQIPLDSAARIIARTFGQPSQVLVNCSACAAGAQAIGHAFQSVRSGRFELAVCGGFDSMINPLGIGGFQLLGALTTDNGLGAQACRPFDATRAGTVLGEGAAMVILEPLDNAQAEGKPVLAEVCGYGSSLDAYNLSAPDPEGDGAARAMRAALSDAGIEAKRIDHINAHGTGTLLNDEVETRAIRKVFEQCWEGIPVSATKSLTGHCIAAAGAIEFGACLLAMSNGVLPPNTSLERVGKGCELNHVTQPGTAFDGEYALSNSLGFGGQNATLILRRGD